MSSRMISYTVEDLIDLVAEVEGVDPGDILVCKNDYGVPKELILIEFYKENNNVIRKA
jgi:hypothetical protein